MENGRKRHCIAVTAVLLLREDRVPSAFCQCFHAHGERPPPGLPIRKFQNRKRVNLTLHLLRITNSHKSRHSPYLKCKGYYCAHYLR